MPLPTLNPILVGMGFQRKTLAEHMIKSLNQLLYLHHSYVLEIAVPSFKKEQSNCQELEQHLNVPLRYISFQTLQILQKNCHYFSQRTYDLIGLGSVAEACALAIKTEKDEFLFRHYIFENISFSFVKKG